MVPNHNQRHAQWATHCQGEDWQTWNSDVQQVVDRLHADIYITVKKRHKLTLNAQRCSKVLILTTFCFLRRSQQTNPPTTDNEVSPKILQLRFYKMKVFIQCSEPDKECWLGHTLSCSALLLIIELIGNRCLIPSLWRTRMESTQMFSVNWMHEILIKSVIYQYRYYCFHFLILDQWTWWIK